MLRTKEATRVLLLLLALLVVCSGVVQELAAALVSACLPF
jgi:hypothetical protein